MLSKAMIDAATDKKKCRMFGTKLQTSLQITAKQLCERISIAPENDRKKRKSTIAGKKNDWLGEESHHSLFLFIWSFHIFS